MPEKFSFERGINKYAFSEKCLSHDGRAPALNLFMPHGVDALLAVQGLRILLPEMLQVAGGHCFGLDAVQIDDVAFVGCSLNSF